MKHLYHFKAQNSVIALLIMAVLMLSACTATPAAPEPTTTPPPASTPAEPTSTPTPAPLPLEGNGPYRVAVRNLPLNDHSRTLHNIFTTIWYPAMIDGDQPDIPPSDAEPDASGAPYPLILTYTALGEEMAPHLASYGYIIVGISNQFPWDRWNNWLIDYPLDLLYVLDQLAENPPPELAGMIDTDHTGVLGYSFSGYNALALTGTQIDPEFYLGLCANPDPTLPEWWVDYLCDAAEDWPAFEEYALGFLDADENGLWQPMTDPRILAAMPMAPEGAWLFGERGLAAATMPVLIIDGTEDEDCPYQEEAVFIYEHLGSTELGLISYIGRDHFMIFDRDVSSQVGHFAAAFFGNHLQGHGEYADYYSADFVNAIPGLAWGAVE